MKSRTRNSYLSPFEYLRHFSVKSASSLVDSVRARRFVRRFQGELPMERAVMPGAVLDLEVFVADLLGVSLPSGFVWRVRQPPQTRTVKVVLKGVTQDQGLDLRAELLRLGGRLTAMRKHPRTRHVEWVRGDGRGANGRVWVCELRYTRSFDPARTDGLTVLQTVMIPRDPRLADVRTQRLLERAARLHQLSSSGLSVASTVTREETEHPSMYRIVDYLKPRGNHG